MKSTGVRLTWFDCNNVEGWQQVGNMGEGDRECEVKTNN